MVVAADVEAEEAEVAEVIAAEVTEAVVADETETGNGAAEAKVKVEIAHRAKVTAAKAAMVKEAIRSGVAIRAANAVAVAVVKAANRVEANRVEANPMAEHGGIR